MKADDELIFYNYPFGNFVFRVFPEKILLKFLKIENKILFRSNTVFLGNLGSNTQNRIQFYICLGAAGATNKREASAQFYTEK